MPRSIQPCRIQKNHAAQSGNLFRKERKGLRDKELTAERQSAENPQGAEGWEIMRAGRGNYQIRNGRSAG